MGWRDGGLGREKVLRQVPLTQGRLLCHEALINDSLLLIQYRLPFILRGL